MIHEEVIFYTKYKEFIKSNADKDTLFALGEEIYKSMSDNECFDCDCQDCKLNQCVAIGVIDSFKTNGKRTRLLGNKEE